MRRPLLIDRPLVVSPGALLMRVAVAQLVKPEPSGAAAALCDMGASQVCCSKTATGGTCQVVPDWGNMCCPTGEEGMRLGVQQSNVAGVVQWALSCHLPRAAVPSCTPCCSPLPPGGQHIQVLPCDHALPGSGGLRLQQVLRQQEQ